MKIEIYSKEECSLCEKVKKACQIKNLEYSEIKINAAEDINKLNERVGTPVRSVPQIFVDDEYIGGHVEFMRFLGKL